MAHKSPLAPSTLMQKRDIEIALGISRSRAGQITSADDFPAPVDDGLEHKKPVWWETDVRAWAAPRPEYDYPKEPDDQPDTGAPPG
jgi:hypothetical protein